MARRNRKNERNYYRVLFVQPDAPMEVVQASYRTIMQKLRAHPDLGGDHWNATVINEAFEVLTDPERRRAYDATLFRKNEWRTLGRQNAGQRQPASAPEAEFEAFKPRVLD